MRLAPSILAADFARLGEQVTDAERAGADRIHVDVMDGHFVPNLSMGPAVVQSVRRVTRLPLETHLMVSDPDAFLEAFAEAGSDSLLVHWEGNANLHRTVQRIKALGKRAGVAINPATPTSVLKEILGDVEQAAESTFRRLGMERTRDRNAVLFFFVPARRRFAVIGDEGIHARVGPDFWPKVVEAVAERFRKAEYTEGLVEGIETVGRELAAHFPFHAETDVNELPDEIDFGRDH